MTNSLKFSCSIRKLRERKSSDDEKGQSTSADSDTPDSAQKDLAYVILITDLCW